MMAPVSRETSPLEKVSALTRYLANHPLVKTWVSSYAPGVQNPAILEGIHDALVPLLILILYQTTHKPLLCLTDKARTAETLFERLSYLVPAQVGRMAPQSFDPDQEHRFSLHDEQTLNLFITRRLPFLIMPAHLFQRGSTPEGTSAPPELALRAGKRMTLKHLQHTLLSWRYQRVDRVTLPGSFAVRGGIVDMFPLGLRSPVRVELFGDEVESLRRFDPISQRMLPEETFDNITIPPPFRLNAKRPLFPANGIPSLHITEAGPPHILTFTPHTVRGDGPGPAIDLACISRGPFHGKINVFNEVLSQLTENKEFTVFLFYDSHYAEKAETDPLFRSFQRLISPIEGAFSSEPLGLFCTSLGHVYRLPKPVRPRPEMPGEHAPTVERPGITTDFVWGGPLVHEDFGIGLYRGLSTIEAHGGKQECVTIAYRGGDLVHVPFHRLDRIHPYVGLSKTPPDLSNLGSTRWQRAKQKTRRSAENVVDEFIDLYALRHKAIGFRFSPDSEIHAALRESFPHTETADQLAAYDHIRQDMEREVPADRLICGDVGFGKTEIAIRAALKAVYDNKQVVVLTPTTILANQHYVTFMSRLDPLGVRVALLSRFTPLREAKETIHKLENGNMDVIVGTHRLLSADLRFADLGVLIIDEEHRFGAKQKEQLKKFRTEVDVLAMSATPIPRTLQFSLLGIRDVSTIMTPPRERLSVITRLVPFHHETIRSAVMAEIERDGQIFFVHDEVKTIEGVNNELQKIFPSLKLGIAHGQLPGRRLEKTMVDFLNRKLDLLVCTTIIEAGIDLPNVNTIFINNAHRFGLSQIHQMRGRVGRSDRQAFCFLLVPEKKKLTPEALDRLRTIEYYSSLGSGYALALKDLEMRGAGNLFGVEQSGHISSVGFHLFCKIVEEAANQRLNKEPSQGIGPPTEISFTGIAMIPSAYVSDVADRLRFYRRLSTARHLAAVEDVASEIGDRFGPVPLSVDNLLRVAALQVRGQGSGLKKLSISDEGIWGLFNPSKDREKVLSRARNLQLLFQKRGYPLQFKWGPEEGLEFSITKKLPAAQEGLRVAEYLFELSPGSSNFS